MSTNAKPAHSIWVELATRITTQRLHYRSGEEETAARSIYSLFAKTRTLLEENADAMEFQKLAERMLNQTIRPYTARWHGWMLPDPVLKDKDGQPLGRFRDPQVRRKFREELRELQPLLLGYQKAFDLMRRDLANDADGVSIETWAQPDANALGKLIAECTRTEAAAKLGVPLIAGILPQVWIGRPLQEAGAAAKSRANPGSNEFPGALSADDIERAERKFINGRRSLNSEDPVKDAIGLALSGGGIKSATFCLGVVQELASRGIFSQLDYLSTVSGGGYLGSFLSAYLGKNTGTPETKVTADARIREALLPQADGAEAKAVRHLRNHSQYLLNGGLYGKLSIAGVVATGILANLLMILPMPLFIAVGLAVLNAAGFWGDVWSGPGLLPAWSTAAGDLFVGTGLVLALLWFFLPGVQRWTNRSDPGAPGANFRAVWEFGSLMMAVITAFAGLLYFYPSVLKCCIGTWIWLNAHLHGFAPNGKTLTGIMGAIPVIFGGLGYVFRTSWIKNLLLRAFVISGPVFYAFVVLYVSIRLGVGNDGQWSIIGVASIAFIWLLWSLFMVNLNTLSPHHYYRARLCECYLVVPAPPKLNWWGKLRALIWEGYVPNTETSFGTVPQVRLSTIGDSGAAPYHLINAIINLPASKNRNLRGRGGDFFVMTRDFCGSPVTGYIATRRLEQSDPRVDLGTAMAISAAAANTNMGWRTEGGMGSFRFLMTLLNVRLGYWLPNYRLCKSDELGNPAPIPNHSVGSPYLLAEMGGRIQENMNLLNVSDGGHIENLGVYELLRRKCKFIISIDGGANRDIVGGDLQRLERYASIDFGIGMEYDLTELQPDEEGISRASAILVKILYSASEIGWMIYLRPSITGNEPAYVTDHWKQSPPFPYDSILDQVFDEEQFEGYRRVGEEAMRSLYREELNTNSNTMSVQDWFQNLATQLLPDNDAAFK